MTHPMKNPSKIIVPILIRSVSSLRHRVYCILSLELGWSCVFLTDTYGHNEKYSGWMFYNGKGGFTQNRGQLPSTPRTVLGVGVPQRDLYFSRRPTPSKHFPWSFSVTFDLWFDFHDGAFRVLFETVCQRYRAINAASDRGFKLFFSLWCPLRRGKKEEPMVLEEN